MLRLRTVLAASDFSQSAHHAAQRAAMLAKAAGATLELLHVAAKSPLDRLRDLVAGVPAELEQRLLDAEMGRLQQLAEELSDAYGVTARTHVASGPLLQELVEQFDRLAVDLPVIGAHGENGLQHLILGSTAARLLSKSLRPMLIVKQPPREPYRRVLVPVDFSPATLPALAVARVLAPDADIVLLHAFAVPFEGQLLYAGISQDEINHYRVAARQEALEQLRALRGQGGFPPDRVTTQIVHGYAVEHILAQAEESGCDLVVMGKHGRGKIEETLIGGVTRHVLAQSKIDVAVSV